VSDSVPWAESETIGRVPMWWAHLGSRPIASEAVTSEARQRRTATAARRRENRVIRALLRALEVEPQRARLAEVDVLRVDADRRIAVHEHAHDLR
jgi:ribosomal 50S subunit-associated protein YjgA (DUF615 family)